LTDRSLKKAPDNIVLQYKIAKFKKQVMETYSFDEKWRRDSENFSAREKEYSEWEWKSDRDTEREFNIIEHENLIT